MAELLEPLQSLFQWVDDFESSWELRGSQYAWAWVVVLHVVSVSIFAGLVVMMDLRLLGIGHMRTPFSVLQRRLFPWQMVGMVLSVGTGVVLLYAQPMTYYANVFFWMKMMMMGIAGVNALAFHYISYDTVSAWDTGRTPPGAARLAGVLSIVLWAGVIVAGRLIPYNWFR
jgi:hypothetical protein